MQQEKHSKTLSRAYQCPRAILVSLTVIVIINVIGLLSMLDIGLAKLESFEWRWLLGIVELILIGFVVTCTRRHSVQESV